MHRKNQVLLFEKDLRKVLIKKGLEPELADICHEISDKYSIFVANFLFFSRNFYITDKESYVENELYKQYIPAAIAFIEELFKEQEKPTLPKKPNDISYMEARELSNQLRYIKDWDSDVERTDKTDIKSLTWEQALEKAREYHREKAENALSRGLETKSDQTYVMKFPDGSYWLNLKSQYCREEGDAMGHCGNASDGGILYSLRDKQGVPSITAEIDRRSKTANQIYGRGNSTPAEKYHKRILELIGKLNLQTVKVKDYGGKSLNVEEDISDELKRWFEEEYDYYPSKGGISDAEIARGDEIITATNRKILYSTVYIDHSDGYIGTYTDGYLNFPYLETDEDFWETDLGKIISEKVDDKFYDSEVSDNGLRFSSSESSPSYDAETDKGHDSEGESYSNYIDWVRAVASEAENFNNEIKKMVDEIFEDYFFSDQEENEENEENEDEEDSPKIPKNTLLFLQSFDNFKREFSKEKSRDHYYDLSWTFAKNLVASIHLFKKDEWLGSTPVISEELLGDLQNSIKNTFKRTFEYENSTFLHNPEPNASIINRLSSNELEEFVDKLEVKVKQNVVRGYNRYKPLLEIDIQLIPINDNSQKEWLNLYYTARVSEAIEQTIDKFYNNISIKKENYSFKKYYNFKYGLITH